MNRIRSAGPGLSRPAYLLVPLLTLVLVSGCTRAPVREAVKSTPAVTPDAATYPLHDGGFGQSVSVASGERGEVVLYEGTDYEIGRKSTSVAISTDKGISFSSIRSDLHLNQPAAVLVDNRVVLVGQNCERGDRDGEGDEPSCSPDSLRSRTVVLDLNGKTSEAQSPGRDGLVAVGAIGGQAYFAAPYQHGGLLRYDVATDKWAEAGELPSNTTAVCQMGNRLVAISTMTDPTDGTSPQESIVRQGEPAWLASTSNDQGRDWSEPKAFKSSLAEDYPFTLGIACGREKLVAYTSQMGIFDPSGQSWTNVTVPRGSGLMPGSAATWTSPTSLGLWPASDMAAGGASGVVGRLDVNTSAISPEASTATEAALGQIRSASEYLSVSGTGGQRDGYVVAIVSSEPYLVRIDQ